MISTVPDPFFYAGLALVVFLLLLAILIGEPRHRL